MKTNKDKISRRKFLGTSALALTATTILPSGLTSCSPAGDEVIEEGSKFGGVNIGVITYCYRTLAPGLLNIIEYIKTSGITTIELMGADLEDYWGIPQNPLIEAFSNQSRDPMAQDNRDPNQEFLTVQAGSGFLMVPLPLSPELQTAYEKWQQDVIDWRLNFDIKKAVETKKLFDDAGIEVHIVKFIPADWSDGEIDYAFEAAKAMGANCVTNEVTLEIAKRLGPFAEKHGMYVGMHNHYQFTEPGFDIDEILATNPAVMLNFDIGHYYGSTGKNPVDFIIKYHDRIFSLHIKDKTGPNASEPNANQVWGQGQTPLEEVLLLLKEEKYPIYADIELEYPIKPWSDPIKEVNTCMKYARQILI